MINDIFKSQKIKKIYLIINYISLAPTILLLANSLYNLTLSIPYELKFTMLLDLERTLFSLIIIALMTIEFLP